MDLTIKASAERVIDQLGPRQREVVYAKALALELREGANMSIQVEPPIPVVYTPTNGVGVIVGVERADLMVMSPWLAIIECKIAECVTDDHAAQARRYAQNCNTADCYAVCFGRSGAVDVVQVVVNA